MRYYKGQCETVCVCMQFILCENSLSLHACKTMMTSMIIQKYRNVKYTFPKYDFDDNYS